MRYSEVEVLSDDATPLFVRRYQPDEEGAKRTLIIIHGASEHGHRYDHVARLIVNRGWNVITGDLRGHGRSGGTAMHVNSFMQYAADVEAIRQHFQLVPEKTAILGHSMGGLVVIRHAQLYPGTSSGLIVISPLLGVNVRINPLMVLLGRLVSIIAPRTRFSSRYDSGQTTRNLESLARKAEDPLVHHSVTASWYFAMKLALKAAWREASKIRIPTLLLQAGSDGIVDPKAAEPWFHDLASPDKTYRLFPEHYHELLNETDWEETATSVADWLDNRFVQQAPPPPTSTPVHVMN